MTTGNTCGAVSYILATVPVNKYRLPRVRQLMVTELKFKLVYLIASSHSKPFSCISIRPFNECQAGVCQDFPKSWKYNGDQNGQNSCFHELILYFGVGMC